MINRSVGILAHVDAGKTTFSEQVLCRAGVLRAPGRVDHGDAFLDAHPLERQRGITIFSDQAVFERGGARWFWVDTPGHADFFAEAERALSAVDLAVLLVSGPEGVQSHTEALWELVNRLELPVMVFVNKTDRAGFDRVSCLKELRDRLSGDCVDMLGYRGGELPEAVAEAAAERDEALLDRLLAGDFDLDAWLDGLRRLFWRRELFPVYFGAALNGEGIDAFLDALQLFGSEKPDEAASDPGAPFDALVYKVRHDDKGGRIAFFRVLAGSVGAREEFALPGGGTGKLNELRLYSGAKYAPLNRAEAGMLVAATGLSEVRPGDYLGQGAARRSAFSAEPMLMAGVEWAPAVPAPKALNALRQLEAEDPALNVTVGPGGAASLSVMGPIQLEVIERLMLDRFGIRVRFGALRVMYMETISAPAVGIGHYEPLRHYAEVQLRLVPGPRGSGVRFASRCHVDELSLNWQRLIETHVYEKAHRGVLTGAKLTDVVVELLHGRAHPKHTEGGDFRQSTYRAIRNALMYAPGVLLEPVCRFSLRGPAEDYGRVMAELTRMRARLDPVRMEEARFSLSGEAAFAAFSGFIPDYMAATHGRGTMRYHLDHYEPCRDAEAVIAEANYNPLADDTPDSVFCAHGAGYNVAWNEVRACAHIPPEPDQPGDAGR